MKTRSCANCGHGLDAFVHHPNTRYCSIACGIAFRQRKAERKTIPTVADKTCRECAQPFTASQPAAVYCSPVCRDRNIRARKYGMRDGEFTELLKFQNNRCAICGCENPNHIDHSHKHGSVRGILCRTCNVGIGMLRDDAASAKKAHLYLEASDI